MADSYRFAVNSDSSQKLPPNRAQQSARSSAARKPVLLKGHSLAAVPEDSPACDTPPSGYSYRTAVASGSDRTLSPSRIPDTIAEDSTVTNKESNPPGYSYRVAVGDPVPSHIRGGFLRDETDGVDDHRNMPGFSYRVAVGEPGRAPSDVGIDLADEETASVQNGKKKFFGISFKPESDSNTNPAFDEHGSRTSLNSVSSKGDSVYQMTPDGRVLKQVVMNRPDGSKVIVTDADRRCHKPLKEKYVNLLWIFSVVAIVIFFPTGIPAFIFARRTKMKYYEGREPTTMYRTNICAKRAERLIIASIVLAILLIIIVSVAATLGRNSNSGSPSGHVGIA